MPLMLETINVVHSVFASKPDEQSEDSKSSEKGKARREYEAQKRAY